MKRSVLPVHLVGAVLLLAFSGCVAAQHGRDAGPAAAAYTFPPEWAPHEAVWLGWSTNPQHHRVQVEMIQAMAPHVRIRLMVTTDRAKANTLV